MSNVSPAQRFYMSLLGSQAKKAEQAIELCEQGDEDADLLAATLVDETKVRLDAERQRESER